MDTSYTKLSRSLLTSSIWVSEDDHTRLVWITMLALSDRFGDVAATVPGLAAQAHVPMDSAVRAIAKLESPDPYSRTPDEDGRRIMKIDGGWRIVNRTKYRDQPRGDPEWQRERNRLKQERHRNRVKKAKITGYNNLSPVTVTPKAEAEAKKEQVQGLAPSENVTPPSPPQPPPKSSPPAKPDPALSAYVQIWNDNCDDLPKVELFTDSRRRQVGIRVKEGLTPERFKEAVLACRSKPFLRGQGENHWKVTFDWLFRNDRNIERAITEPWGSTQGGLSGTRTNGTGGPTRRTGNAGVALHQNLLVSSRAPVKDRNRDSKTIDGAPGRH